MCIVCARSGVHCLCRLPYTYVVMVGKYTIQTDLSIGDNENHLLFS